MIGFPSKAIEDDVSLRFFSVELSHRKVVLSRGGPLWKGLGGISRTRSLCTAFPRALSSVPPSHLVSAK